MSLFGQAVFVIALVVSSVPLVVAIGAFWSIGQLCCMVSEAVQ